MRMWIDQDKRLLTDEQLVRLIAYHGSLQDALTHGNIRLASESSEAERHDEPTQPRRRLADYLAEG